MTINYHPELVWSIDRILLTYSLLLAAVILIFAAIKQALAIKRADMLSAIENNLSRLAKSGAGAVKDACPAIVGKAAEEDILQVLYDKNRIFPKGLEQSLKQCLIDSGKLSDLEHIAASSSRDKWRRVQALICVGYADSPKALEILGRSVNDRDEDISYFSMEAVSHIKKEESARILLECLKKGRFERHRIISFLEGVLTGLNKDSQKKILEAIAKSDKISAQHLGKKLNIGS